MPILSRAQELLLSLVLKTHRGLDKKIFLIFSAGNGAGRTYDDDAFKRFGYEMGFIFELDSGLHRVNWAKSERVMQEFVAYLKQN